MGEWQHGIFGCFNNCGVCILTFFLPCVTAGQNAEAVGKVRFSSSLMNIGSKCISWGGGGLPPVMLATLSAGSSCTMA